MKVWPWILFFILLGATLACGARELVSVQVLDDVLRSHIQQQGEIQATEEVPWNGNICVLCKKSAKDVLSYLTNDETEGDIIEVLYTICSRVPALTQKCIMVVDQYVPHFFSKVSSVQPEKFCRTISLCKDTVQIDTQLPEDKCGMCHNALSEVLIKLQDPDIQLDILEILLKRCKSMQNYMKKCKKMVFEYGPLILSNVEQFLETTDICTMVHACNSSGKLASVANS